MALSFSILRLRNFRLLLSTRFFLAFALQAQAIVVGWQVYSITRSPFMLGLTGLTEAVPALACALFAGHIIDISHPYKIYRRCQAVIFLNTMMLLLVAGGILPVPGEHVLLVIFTGIFISGVARSFAMPAGFPLLSLIVSRSEIPAANAWQNSTFQTAAIAGPALAGIIYGGYGPRAAWLIPALSATFAFTMSYFIKVEHPERKEKRPPALQSIKEGWLFMVGNRVLLAAMGLDMLAVLFGGAIALLPAFADQVLHTGSEGLGALRAATAIGSIVSALALAVYPMKKVSARRMIWIVAGFGLCMIGFGLSRNFWLSMFFLVLSGLLDSVSVVIRSTLVQLLTPAHMLGRVSSVSSMFIISSNELGAFESGMMAKLMGLVPSVVFGGIMTLFVAGGTAAFSPEIRRTVIDTGEQKKT